MFVSFILKLFTNRNFYFVPSLGYTHSYFIKFYQNLSIRILDIRPYTTEPTFDFLFLTDKAQTDIF